MTKHLLLPSRGSYWAGRCLAWLFLLALAPAGAWAQTVKTIGVEYANFTAAITDININFATGGITVNVPAGYTETPTAALPLLLAQGTGGATGQIIFQKSGAGANPNITAQLNSTSTTVDGIVRLNGADYVTFDGIDLSENAANVTATTQMEFGYALFRPLTTNGCQNNTFKNCVITLNKTNVNTFGIYGAGGVSTLITTVAATTTAGANSANKVDGCIITNSATGIYFTASTLTALANYDQNNEIGVVAANQIYNFGTTATGWGIGGNYQNGFKVVNNTVNNTLNYAGGTTSAVAASTVTSTLRGVYGNAGPSASITITGNTITLASGSTTSGMTGIDNGIGSTAAGNTVNITGNTVTNCTYATATTGAFLGITSSATAATVNLTGNFVTNNSTPGTGTMTLISSSAVAAGSAVNINNNTLTGNSKTPVATTASTSLLCVTLGSATTTISGNTINNNSIVTLGTSTTACTLTGINSTATSTPSENITGNTVTGLTISGTSTATTHTLRGIVTAANGTGDVQTLTGNVIGGLAIASGSGTVTGISVPTGGGTGSTISRNKIYDLSATGTAGIANGLTITAGGTYMVSNNLIGDLRAPAATGLLAIAGLNITSGTQVNAYFNTIYLNATGGATFGTSGVYLGSTTPILDLRDNIVVNTSTAAGTGGYTAALRRVSGTAATVPANYATTSNNNLFWAGASSATNLIYVEGTTTATNPQQTLAAYKAFMANRDQASVTENPPFLGTDGTLANFLHINTGISTQVESGGAPAGGITTDVDGIDVRNLTTPDIGADEGTFTPNDMTAPSITYTALGGTGSTGNRTLTTTITDGTGVATGLGAPRIYFKKSTGGSYFSAVATSISGSTYTFTISAATLGGVMVGDIIQYYVAAQDNSSNNNIGSTPSGATGINPPGSAGFSGTPNSYTILPSLAGNYYVGTSTHTPPAVYATLTAAAAAYNGSALLGAVNFILIDPAYSAATSEVFPVTFNANADANATNVLTIKPETGVTATVTGSSAATSVILLNGADYVTLDGSNNGTTTRNLTLTTANTTTGSALVLVASLGTGAGATFNTVKNLNLVGGTPTVTTAFGVYAASATLSTSGTGADNDNLTVQNNVITTVYNAVYARGVAATGLLDNLLIESNQIGSATAGSTVTFRGVDVQNATAPVVRINRIEGMTTVSTLSIAAIDLGTNVTNAVVSRNYIANLRSLNAGGYGAYGINISSATGTSGIEISNNMIMDVLTYGDAVGTTFNAFGIRIVGGTGHKLYYNSVALTGNQVDASADAGLSAALVITAGTGMDVRNNIFSNSQTGESGTKSYAFYVTAGATPFTTINYNDYYVSGANGVLAFVASLDRADITAVRTGTGQDLNSINQPPPFTNTSTDLHLNAVAAALPFDGTATPVSVVVDYDGTSRSGTPDIGADEFSIPLQDVGITALVQPGASVCYSGSQPVQVTIRNYDATATTAAIPVSVTVTKPGAVTEVVSGTFSGSIPASGTANFTVGNYAVTTAGSYTFDASTSYFNDPVAGNNALATQTVTVSIPPTLSFTGSTTICNGSSTTLTFSPSTYTTLSVLPTTGTVVNNVLHTITFNPTTSTAYTVTGNDGAGAASCTNTVAVSITVNPTPNAPTLTPGTPAAYCAGGNTVVVASTNTNLVANQTLLTENFNVIPAAWTTTTTSTTSTGVAAVWALVTPPYTYASLLTAWNGANGTPLAFANSDAGNSGSTTNTQLISPSFSTYSAATLTFDHLFRYLSGTSTVDYSVSGAGGPWIPIVSYTSSQGVNPTSTTPGTVAASLVLPAGALNQANVRIRYNYVGGWDYYWGVDNVLVTGTAPESATFAVTGGPGASVTGNNITFNPTTTTTYNVTASYPSSPGCSSPATPITITVNPRPTATASNNGPICAGSTTTVSFALTGTAPWNLTYSDGTTSTPVTGITTSPYTFTTGALSASTTYTVTALSDANCTATASPVASTIVTVRPLPTFSTTQTNVSCFGSSTGSITVTAAGGTAPYEYSINNGVTYTASAINPYTFTGLAAGTYQVLVKGQFCTAATAQAVTISQPASATAVTATKTDETASGANDGTVTATGSGGTSPYQYSLDGTTFLPTTATAGPHTFTGQMAGSYTVTVRDANACTATTTVTVGTAASVCTTTTYTGAAPNDGSNWFNAANWTACVPTRTVDATIPVGLANYPALTTQATAEVRTLTIASGGSLAQSAGILAVYGNLSNSGTTTLTGGMVSLRGSSPTVTGMSTFYALEVDLSGGTMALSNATSISSGLTMKTGVLSTSSFTLTLLTGSLLSETESSYLLGTVIVPDRTLTAGTAEGFSGIGLVLTPAVGSVSPGLTPVVRTTGTALTGAGSSVSITRYFDIQPATNTGLNVDMVFNYFTHEQNGIPTGNLALFKSVTTTSGPWANQSPITAGIKTISKAGITDFSIWTLGNLGAPLPVELTRFEATRAGSDAALTWSTATEKNSRGFEVQVSTDGRSYRVLSFVASPTAASTSPREYAYLDREASKAGLRYYRLRQLDLDGTATFSPVRTLRFEGKDARSFTAAPNPFRERLTLTVELPAGLVAAPALLSLTDAAGRSLLTQRTPALPAGTSQLELPDLAPLASGVYFVHLAVPGQPVQHLKVVKE
ncbi:beta strand repeat-containing protein [Hymenobacter siberiensis]|uniref:beta strand repeat-containing protein n=1 Tax=Hymenobacter siberiensis TaxID=2848396 RepID=UPI001C1DE9D3|nr:SprB repeat-containing protein [Hymenobacter siberiensis]